MLRSLADVRATVHQTVDLQSDGPIPSIGEIIPPNT
jgi:hypothetical protein